MKKITILFILLLFVLQSKAQNIVAVEKAVDYWDAGTGIPVGTYLKDINNLFAPYVGTWKGTINNKTYTFFITKITESSNGRIVDKLIIYHTIFDHTVGYIIEDSRIGKARPHITGRFFQKNLAYYVLTYIGQNSKCGRNGEVFIKKASATTMLLKLSAYGEVGDVRRCPGGQKEVQVLPTESFVTLTKQ